MKNPLARWRPSVPTLGRSYSHPLSTLESAFDRFLDDFHHSFNYPATGRGEGENWQLIPSVDIVETKDSYKVEAEVPGMGPEDLKVRITDHTLVIEGAKTTSQKDKGQHYPLREIAYGAYYRSITLPDSVDTTNPKASFKKGMLWVELPKKASGAAGMQEIPVESA